MYSPVVPSSSFLCRHLLKYLTNHPLFIAPLVYNPSTLEYVPISQYRFMGGISINDGLTCSIFPGFTSNNPDASPSPADIKASVLYKPYEMGNQGRTHDEARYSFIIQFTHRGINADGYTPSTDIDLTNTPSNAIIYPNDIGLVDLNSIDTIDVYLNPSLDIVSNYLELTRLALCDIEYHKQFYLGNPEYHFPGTYNNIEVIHQDFSSLNWTEKASSVFCTGYLLISLTLYVSRGWREKFNLPLTNINLDVTKDNLDSFNIKQPKRFRYKEY